MNEHPKAELLRAIADGKDMEQFVNGIWYTCFADTALNRISTNQEVRVKVRMLNIGGITVPEPLRKAPKEGARIFIPDCLEAEAPYTVYWDGGARHNVYLKKGLCHSTRQAAIETAQAINKLLSPP